MSAEDLDLSGVKSINQLFARTKNGSAAIELATKLGIWTSSVHLSPTERPAFVKELSGLTPAQLSDAYGRWTAEFGRILELSGAIAGQEAILKIQIKSALASVRSRIRKEAPATAKPYTATQLADLADEDPAIIDLYEQSALLAVTSAHISASKEATAQYIASLSREIAWRDAQIKGKLY